MFLPAKWKVMNWRDQALESVVTVWDLLAANPNLLTLEYIQKIKDVIV